MTPKQYTDPGLFPLTTQTGLDVRQQMFIDAVNHDGLGEYIDTGEPLTDLQREVWAELQEKQRNRDHVLRQLQDGADGTQAAAKEAKDQLPGGLADNLPDERFAAAALAQGAKVEREHTSDTNVAKEIAKDHLVEDPNYYRKLATIEGKNLTERNAVVYTKFFADEQGRRRLVGQLVYDGTAVRAEPANEPRLLAVLAQPVSVQTIEGGRPLTPTDGVVFMESLRHQYRSAALTACEPVEDVRQ